MSLEFAYRFRRKAPHQGLRDLDRVALTAAVVSDDGDTIPVGATGTIVSVHEGGSSYVVEFSKPVGALATVEPQHIKRIGLAPR